MSCNPPPTPGFQEKNLKPIKNGSSTTQWYQILLNMCGRSWGNGSYCKGQGLNSPYTSWAGGQMGGQSSGGGRGLGSAAGRLADIEIPRNKMNSAWPVLSWTHQGTSITVRAVNGLQSCSWWKCLEAVRHTGLVLHIGLIMFSSICPVPILHNCS